MQPADVACASSNRWDIISAGAVDFQTFWVNRPALPDEYSDGAPRREVADLAALLDAGS